MQILNFNKGSILSRNGRRQINPDAARWRRALENHAANAHGGKVSRKCLGCKRLKDNLQMAEKCK
jgi:hypothetical protein